MGGGVGLPSELGRHDCAGRGIRLAVIGESHTGLGKSHRRARLACPSILLYRRVDSDRRNSDPIGRLGLELDACARFARRNAGLS